MRREIVQCLVVCSMIMFATAGFAQTNAEVTYTGVPVYNEGGLSTTGNIIAFRTTNGNLAYYTVASNTVTNTSVSEGHICRRARFNASDNLISFIQRSRFLAYYDIASGNMVNTNVWVQNQAGDAPVDPVISGTKIAFLQPYGGPEIYDTASGQRQSTWDHGCRMGGIAVLADKAYYTDWQGSWSMRSWDPVTNGYSNFNIRHRGDNTDSIVGVGNLVGFINWGGNIATFDPADQTVVDTGSAIRMGGGMAAAGTKIAFLRQGDWISIHDTATGTTTDTDIPATVLRNYGWWNGGQTSLSMAGGILAFFTSESRIGQDLNGDGDQYDNILSYIDLGNKTPPGWSQGKKKGWDGLSLPPGLAKKNKTPPGFDKGNKTGWTQATCKPSCTNE